MNPMITILASAVVPNGRFGDHHISVERLQYDDGREEFVWRDGYSDPLICTGHDDAMRFFHERTSQSEGAGPMGMFDYIRCKMPLPVDPQPPRIELFQTKDTPTEQLWMDEWVIEEDGRLVRLGYRLEDRSDPRAEPGSLESIMGCMTRVPDPSLDEAVPFHGDIRFYHYETDGEEWWEYIARFSEGLCVRIWCDEYRAALKGSQS